MAIDDAARLDLFLSLGLDKRTAENALVNPKVTANLTAVIQEAEIPNGCSKTVGNLLYTVATKHPGNALVHRPFLLRYIVSAKIKSSAQLDAAFAFLSNVGPESFGKSRFEEACGVGVEVSLDEIQSIVTSILDENMDAILEQRYHINVGNLCGQVRKRSPWADAKIVKEVIDDKLRGILGERTAEDDKKPLKKKKEKPVKVEEQKNTNIIAAPPEEEVNPFSIFPQPEENTKVHIEIFFSHGAIMRPHNSREKLEKHLKVTGGKVFTRFGLAAERGGSCYLSSPLVTTPPPNPKPILQTLHATLPDIAWSAKTGRQTTGTPEATLSIREFHPQCVTDAPTALWARTRACGAHGTTSPSPLPAVLSRKPAGRASLSLSDQMNGVLLASSPWASSASSDGGSSVMVPKLT